MNHDAAVIIAGAGPAGSLAARELAVRGIPVLILEKAIFPRYKVCGAGLTYKILREIPFDVSPVLHTRVHEIVFSHGLKDRFRRSSPDPLMFCTTREAFDGFLLGEAAGAGARVLHGIKVTGVRQDEAGVEVITSTGIFRSELLIGADGASGVVGRAAGLRDHILPGMAWEAELAADPGSLSAYAGTVFLDWGTIPGGYAWVFPKKDHFSLGVGGPAILAGRMKEYYGKFVGYLRENAGTEIALNSGKEPEARPGIRFGETLSFRSWPIPVRVKRTSFHRERILVTGDAAGLTDPLTGEGIYYAVRSGMLAAGACHDYLQGRCPSLERYSAAVNEELMPELLEANRIRYIFNTVPGRIHAFVRDSDRAWRAFGKILRGERRYADVPGGFGRWRKLWGAACRGSRLVYAFREKRFKKRGFV